MAIRDKMVTKAQPYLQPGEQVQAVFAGQKINQWWVMLSALILLFGNEYRTVVVTDRRILVLRGTRWTQTTIKGVLAELPRGTLIGPASGLWWKCTSLGAPLYVHKRFHKDVLAADTQRPAGAPQGLAHGLHQSGYQQAPPPQAYGAPGLPTAPPPMGPPPQAPPSPAFPPPAPSAPPAPPTVGPADVQRQRRDRRPPAAADPTSGGTAELSAAERLAPPAGSGPGRLDPPGDLAEREAPAAGSRARRSAAPPRRRRRGRRRPSRTARAATRRCSGSGPLIVPEPKRSPVRSEAPLTVRCASIWAGDQYVGRTTVG